nr:immunoglobulin light chain junction region [Macaca mulatta]MOV77866.1 immunoglobulin light chain junction region [Macaca mulatta]MOV77980.1 immunoglobulin light chain junction region [Macaca mulatta]MOV78207.1 immunoglobulin light chain junction region [Macaca mulatta]MOV78378.1 immunoglobulin light chain junction region [Macaca mulatta]
CQQYNSLPYIF